MIRKVKAVIVGFGNRGQVYGDYSLFHPEELEIVAVVDSNENKLEEAKKKYKLEDDLYLNLDDFLRQKIDCDIVINATMDQQHYITGKKIINAGYNMLIEKPVVPNSEQLLEMRNLAKEKGVDVFVCHVLRYTPFYNNIKKALNENRIGKIFSIEINEHVWEGHYLTSYVRGKWNSEKKCGSSFLLAKSCHDFDLLCWLNNFAKPQKVASFGDRSWFIQDNMPKDASEFCLDCKYVDSCQYSAKRLYLIQNEMPFLVWDSFNKSYDEITYQEKIDFLRKDNYGRCAYIAGGEIVDRQVSIISFSDGSVCSFMLTAGVQIPGRYIHIVGSKGEIKGRLEDDKFQLVTYDEKEKCSKEETIIVKPLNEVKYGGHSGGDYSLMSTIVKYLNGDRTSVSLTSIEDSINGHLCVFAADKARKQKEIVDVESI